MRWSNIDIKEWGEIIWRTTFKTEDIYEGETKNGKETKQKLPGLIAEKEKKRKKYTWKKAMQEK